MSPGEECTAFKEGDRVRITGLKARTDLNGCQGSIVEWDPAEERWKVHMDDNSGKMLRRCHLELVDEPSPTPGDESKTSPSQPEVPTPAEEAKTHIAPNAIVRVKGLKVRAELNGLQGVVTAWNSIEESWSVRFHGAEASAQDLFGVVKNFREENLEISTDTSESQSSAEPFVKAGLALGSFVRISKLQKRPELNGQLGTVVGWDKVEDRCQVRLADGSGLLLKACNMELVSIEAGARVQVTGLQVRPELNGATGTVVEYDEKEKRWKVLLDDGNGKLLKESNLKLMEAEDVEAAEDEDDENMTPGAGGAGKDSLPQKQRPITAGALVQVVGLQVRPDLNGCRGRVIEWDDKETRWKVLLENCTGKLLKESNLKLLQSAGEFPTGDEEEETPEEPQRRFQPGDRISVKGLQVQKSLNGLCGSIVEWDSSEQRWKVCMDDGTGKMLREENLEAASPAAAGDTAVSPAPTAPPPAPAPPAPPAPAPAPVTKVEAAKPGEPSPSPAKRPSGRHFNPQDRVRVMGLQTMPTLNGSLGTILDYDSDQDRWKVLLDDGSGKLLRPSNLEPYLEGPTAPSAPTAARGPSPKAEPPAVASPVTSLPKDDSRRKIHPGARVRLHSLEQQWQINGQCGTVVDWDRTDGYQRCQVRLDETCAGHSLKMDNLEPLSESVSSGSRVIVRGLRSQPELNGCLGTVRFWDAAEEQWQVMMDHGFARMFRSNNLSPPDSAMDETVQARPCYPLQPGCRVQVIDLKKQKERNGCKGTALEWVDQIERWKVVLDDGSSLLLRTNHLMAIGRGWDSTTAQTCE